MILGIFYARFFPQEGTKIVAQSPEGCIVPVSLSAASTAAAAAATTAKPSSSAQPTAAGASTISPSLTTGPPAPPLFDFDVLQEYIIPRKPFCNRYVTAVDPDGKCAVLGFPVLIRDDRYQRNEFIFNFGLVVDAEGVDQAPYERVVRRLAVTFAEMEKQNGYLSLEGGASLDTGGSGGAGKGGGRRPIESLLEIIKEDLNNYGECMIPVDEANTINMKLFPHHPPPPVVRGWHVPVAKVKFADVVDPTWDLTLQRVIAHIDGVSDVRRIAWLADVSLDLACLALRHLLYYDAIILLDMFFFGACYAPRPPAIHDFIANVDGMVDECAAYACINVPRGGPAGSGSGSGSGGRASASASASAGAGTGAGGGADATGQRRPGSNGPNATSAAQGQRLSNYQLIKLMTTFCVGKSVMEWLRTHHDSGLDVLRHVDVRRFVQFGVIKGCLYRVHKYVVSKQYLAALATGQARSLPDGEGGDPLQRYTDGKHCFDQIITEQNLTDGEIVARLKSLPLPPGDLTVFYR